MKTVDQIIEDILTQEGGYVDDPDDRGGATKYGVSLRYVKGLGMEFDLNDDGVVDSRDIELVTKADAAHVYRRDFFLRPRIDQLPEKLWPQLFDISVNMGGHRAIEFAQKVANFWGADLTEDGRMGPQTRAGVELAVKRAGFPKFNNLLVYHRQKFYVRLTEKRASQKRFLKGWLRRAEDFLVEEHD